MRPAEKEMLVKYILKRSVTSLCCHQGESGAVGEGLYHELELDVWRQPLRRSLRKPRWSQTHAKRRRLTLRFAEDEGTILTGEGRCCKGEVARD